MLGIWAGILVVGLGSGLDARAQSVVRPRLPQDDGLLDLVLRTSADPDLLTARQAALRQKLMDLGVDPRGERRRPSILTLYQQRLADGAGWYRFDEPRQVEILEVDWNNRLVAVYRYPETHLFFTEVDTNVVGVAFEPARDVADSALTVSLNGVEAWNRYWVSIGLQDKWWQQLRTRHTAAVDQRELLNFTLPVRFPLTLERLIGRGDKTNIRISGQETISIAGESTVRDDSFIGNEVNQSRSLFPSLEMKQTLRVNLDGTVGEKIKVRVSHDSEALGNQATQVKLSFEGDEDDIVQTIRAGDIDVTLPGSRLLGVRGSQGGLFGIKVEGAVGPMQYTVLTSKEQSQESRATFNQSGGTTEEFVIASTDYIRNRFFRLTAPVPFFFPPSDSLFDASLQWPEDWEIDINSVELYVSRTQAGNDDEFTVGEGKAFVDRDGFGWFPPRTTPSEEEIPDLQGVPFEEFSRWQRLDPDGDWDPLIQNSEIRGVLLRRTLSDNGTEALAISYNIVDGQGNVVRRVGRSSGATDSRIPDPSDPEREIHFFKLLKPASPETPFGNGGEGPYDITWEYMYRNFYDLKGSDIDPESFQLRIERNDLSLQNPEIDTSTEQLLPWFQVFGLDQLNAQGQLKPDGTPDPDGRVDVEDLVLFNFFEGYVQFPDTEPFDPLQQSIDRYTLTDDYPFDPELRASDLYTKALVNQDDINRNHFFNIVVTHTSTSSRFRLNAFNIKEGSEEVVLDGRVLQRGVDYEIDYFSGEINLTGASAELNPQSNISVSFEVDPLFGGGRTSLHGLYLGYDLGPRRTITTTWLLQSKPNPSRKPRLGEEPSRNWVGNLATKLQFNPRLVRRVANLLPLVRSEEPPVLNVDAEVAVSIPNPNTKNDAYLEDFESVDESVNISMSREGWFWASLPVDRDSLTGVERRLLPAERAFSRWHRPVPGVQRGELNPDLSEQEKRDILPALQLRFESNDSEAWQPDEFGGVMRGFAGEVDLSRAQFLEFWVNDFTGDPNDPSNSTVRDGILHFDFGVINEDFWWPAGLTDLNEYDPEFDTEDTDGNLTLGPRQEDPTRSEDTGLDGLADDEGEVVHFPQRGPRPGDPAGDNFDPTQGDEPYLYINGTEANQRLDSEDLNRNGRLDVRDGYFTLSLDLDDANAIVDIYRDYDDPRYEEEFLVPARQKNSAWRKYRLDLRNLQVRQALPDDPYQTTTPDLERVRYFRIWYENPNGGDRKKSLVFSEMRFLGNRWRSDGVRDLENQIVERLPGDPEDFRVGVKNNKENPEYVPPVVPFVQNNVAEKEQSLQLLYTDLASGHQLRVRKEIPGTQGQDFSVYGTLNFFWRAPAVVDSSGVLRLDPAQDHVENYFWVGADSLNYYEVAFAFGDVELSIAGWQECRVDLGELTNLKENGRREPLFPGSTEVVTRGSIVDVLTGEAYRVTIRGRPDLRRVRRYYAGLRNPLVTTGSGQVTGLPVTGEVLFNEIRLNDVNRDVGLAKRVAANATIPGLGDIGLEWSETDAEFRGLNQPVGSGVLRRDWNARASSNLSNLVPTFGLDVPFSLSTRNSLELPKFLTNSDVELLTAEEREEEKTESKTESFNFQVRKSKPSNARLLQYTIDRFSYSLSGSRSQLEGPQRREKRKSADTKYNYEVRLGQGLGFKLPFLNTRLRLLPNQMTFSSAWRFDQEDRTVLLGDDGIREEPTRISKTVNNTGSFTYNPTGTIRTSYTRRSQRDLVLGQVVFLGIDWGEEKNFNERVSINWTPEARLVKWLQPDVSFSAGYGENRRPTLQAIPVAEDTLDGNPDGLLGTPGQVRHISNNNDVTVRGRVDLTSWLKRRFGPKRSEPTRETPRAAERRERARVDRRRPGRDVPPQAPPPPPAPEEAPADTTGGQQPGGEGQGEEEGQAEGVGPGVGGIPGAEGDLDAAQEALQREEEERRRREEEERGAAGEEPAPEGEAEAEEPERPDQRLNPLGAIMGLVRPISNFVLNLQPISGNYQITNRSNYQHVNDRAGVLYRLGFTTDPGITEPVPGAKALFSSSVLQRTERLSLSTSSQFSENIRIDLSFTGSRGSQSGVGGDRRDYSVEWPSSTLKISRVHEWGMWGDLFTNSTIDLSVRRTKSASGVTDQVENPKTSLSVSPRWTFRFQNGLDTNINVRFVKDATTTVSNELRTNRISSSVSLQKQFDAEGRLKFLRFGRKGTGSTIDMKVDISYDRSIRERFTFATGFTDQRTGRTSLSAAPSFSYQFSRNLRAGLRLSYSRTTDQATNLTTQSIGLGFNATLTF